MEDEHMEYVDREEEEEEEEEQYDENADEDFNPEKADGDVEGASSSSDDEAEAEPAATKKKSKKRRSENVQGDLDSGDEATIKERKHKKRRKDTGDDDESGGEGGFVRTRAQRVAEKEERKHRKRARDGEVTIDVDKVWAELSSVPVGRPAPTLAQTAQVTDDAAMDVDDENKENAPDPASSTELITIKRRIEYAGEITEVEEQVPRGSKEAQKYLAEHPEADPNHRTGDVNESGLSRPLKRPSMFEPNPTGFVKGVAPEKLRLRAPTRLDVLMAQKREEEKKKAQKMSTVEKSRVDWKGFVDKEVGLKDELNEYGRGRGNYLDREGFLGRAQAAREQAARDARLKL